MTNTPTNQPWHSVSLAMIIDDPSRVELRRALVNGVERLVIAYVLNDVPVPVATFFTDGDTITSPDADPEKASAFTINSDMLNKVFYEDLIDRKGGMAPDAPAMTGPVPLAAFFDIRFGVEHADLWVKAKGESRGIASLERPEDWKTGWLGLTLKNPEERAYFPIGELAEHFNAHSGEEYWGDTQVITPINMNAIAIRPGPAAVPACDDETTA